MPLFGKSDTFSENPEVRQVEKMIAKEAREDQKNLDHTIKDLSGAEKTHNKSIKVCISRSYSLAQPTDRALPPPVPRASTLTVRRPQTASTLR